MTTLRILQLDFVNVLAPAHYLVAWTRLGAYRADRFHEFVYGNGTYTEHWAHEACIIPADYWPVLAYRRRAYEPWKQNPLNWLEDEQAYLGSMLERIRAEPPVKLIVFEGYTVLSPNGYYQVLPIEAKAPEPGRQIIHNLTKQLTDKWNSSDGKSCSGNKRRFYP